MSLLIGVPTEVFPGEKRVATVPEVVEKLIKLGFRVAVQSGAGEAANFNDDAYRAAGAEVVPTAAELWAKSDIVFKVRPPSPEEVGLLREGGMLVDFIWPAQNPELMQQLAAKKAHRARDRQPAAPALAGPEDGRAHVDGRRQRLPRCHRGRQCVRPLLQRPDHRGRKDSAGEGLHRGRGRGGTCRDRHCREPGRDRARQRHPGRGGRPGDIARWRIRQGRLRGRGLRRRRLRQGDERRLPEGPARDVREAGAGSRTSSSRPR